MRVRPAVLVSYRKVTILAAILLAAPVRAEVPEDGWVVFASNREDGRHEIYRMKADGSDVVRMTFNGGATPSFSPDGSWILYQRMPPNGTVRVMRPDGSEDHEVCDRTPIFDSPPAFWMKDGSGLVCAEGEAGEGNTEYYLVDPGTLERSLLFTKDEFAHLRHTRFEPGGITPDGRWLVGWAFGLYEGGYTGDNGTFYAPHCTVVLDLEDYQRIYYLGPGCLSSIAPEGGLVYHVTRDSPTGPDIASMHIDDLMTRSSYQIELALADEEWGHTYMPSVSNDSLWLAYSASQGCHNWYDCDYEIFLHQLGAGITERTRLTQNPANDNFPSIFIGELPDIPADAGVDAGIENDDPGSCGCSRNGDRVGFNALCLLLFLPLVTRKGRFRSPGVSEGRS